MSWAAFASFVNKIGESVNFLSFLWSLISRAAAEV